MSRTLAQLYLIGCIFAAGWYANEHWDEWMDRLDDVRERRAALREVGPPERLSGHVAQGEPAKG